MNYQPSLTGDVPVRLCAQCSAPEHGTIACNATTYFKATEQGYDDLLHNRVYRIMDDQLFIVDPGSPPYTPYKGQKH